MLRHQTIAPEPFDLYTGGKQPELAIAFNLACDNVDKYIKTLMGWPPSTTALEQIDRLDDRAFVYLREFLWKGNTENKNTAGYSLEPTDKSIIVQLLKKLSELRNFHSHYWHDNVSVHFGEDLYRFIQNKHDSACGQLSKERSTDAELYFKQQQSYPLFKGRYITQEGRVFLLSFFLNKGQMQQLLQRRKGSKRHDLPEYRFKHKIFTYYCHREGSSWLTTGIDNDKLPSLQEEEQTRIYTGRQASRILAYLKDRPVTGEKKALPLVLSSGQWVGDMSSLLTFIDENQILPDFVFYEKSAPLYDEPEDEKIANEESKHQERKAREGFRRFILPENPAYEFEISYSSLKRVVTDIFLDDLTPEREKEGHSSRKHFIGVLKDCLDTRQYIYENLKAAGEESINPEVYALKKKYSSIYIDYAAHEGSIQERYYNGDEWRTIPISTTLRVEKLLIEWHGSFTLGKDSEYKHRVKLLNAIRPNMESYIEPTTKQRRGGRWGAPKFVGSLDPEPLLFHLAYYFRESENNQRVEDNFLEWGIRYLIDMQLVPDWSFEMEQFVYGRKFNQPESPYKLKKELKWEKNIPDNYRLYITDNQVNIGILLDGKFYRLRMGERLLKYLLYWHFHEPKKNGRSINDLMLSIADDLQRFHISDKKVDLSELKLLEVFAIPPIYFKTKMQGGGEIKKSSPSYKDQVRVFLADKIAWIDEQLSVVKRLNRSQKNDVLMDAYRLFDFSETEGSKFLRKNEYGQMSICHYMLNQNRDKVQGLIEKTFRLRKRLPAELLRIIFRVAADEDGGLDELFIQVLEDRKTFLRKKLDLLMIDGLKPRQIRKEVIDFLPIHIEDENLSREELFTRNQARQESVAYLPFAIHPALTLKYFYPEEFALHGFCKESGEHRNIFLQLRRNASLVSPLPEDNYPEAAYLKVQAHYNALFPENMDLDRYFRKWVGYSNETKVKDILLLQVAERYLEKYDPRSAEEFKRLRYLKGLNLEKLFSAPALIPIPIDQPLLASMEEDYKRALPRAIYLQLRLHQADDYFYRSHKSELFRLAAFCLTWRREELERYRDFPEIMEKLRLWPDGSKENPLTIASLIEARRTNADQAAELAAYIFGYEARVLNGHFEKLGKVEKQAALLRYSGERGKGAYVSFASILEWDVETSSDVKETILRLRTICLHNIVSVNGSLRKRSFPGTGVAEALLISEQLGKDRTEKSIYEVYEAMEKGEEL